MYMITLWISMQKCLNNKMFPKSYPWKYETQFINKNNLIFLYQHCVTNFWISVYV